MKGYYVTRLSGERLQRCYDLASPRIREYLQGEVRFVAEHVRGLHCVLELGCGYGRVMRPLSAVVGAIVGCDTSRESLSFGRSFLEGPRNCALVLADATQLPFPAGRFDATLCVQNGISAFGADPEELVAEAARVTRAGGVLLFSSYSNRLWEDRVAWFREQAREGLIGPIDESRTRDGTIVCTDGFRATTFGPEAFLSLFRGLGLEPSIREVEESSTFCVALKRS